MNPHAPIRPVRKGFIGERVFADVWQRKMSVPGLFSEELGRRIHPLETILQRRPRLRRARVAASFVCWLGTNAGLCFLQQCRKSTNSIEDVLREVDFLMAWAAANARHAGLNSGYRSIEHILSPHALGDGITGRPNWRAPPPLSVDDYETVESVVRWLARRPGVKFVEQCEATIRELQDIEADARRASWAVPS